MGKFISFQPISERGTASAVPLLVAALIGYTGPAGAASAQVLKSSTRDCNCVSSTSDTLFQVKRGAFVFTETNYAAHRPTELWDINVSGVGVGDFARGAKKEPDECFMFSSTNKTRIAWPGSLFTQCQGINKQGAVVGGYQAGHGMLSTGFSYFQGIFHRVSPPSAFSSIVNAINDAGVMVGTCFDPDGGHGFIYDGSQYWLIDAPQALVTNGEGINNKGEVVVTALLDDDHYHAFLIHGERVREMRFPHSRDNQAWHVNNRGEVGFDWIDMAGTQHGGIYDSAKGASFVVDVPGKANTAVLGLNDAGLLVGTFQEIPGTENHGFVARGSYAAGR